jgi:hypothetical protein
VNQSLVRNDPKQSVKEKKEEEEEEEEKHVPADGADHSSLWKHCVQRTITNHCGSGCLTVCSCNARSFNRRILPPHYLMGQ